VGGLQEGAKFSLPLCAQLPTLSRLGAEEV
jgi:hypothetical protein